MSTFIFNAALNSEQVQVFIIFYDAWGQKKLQNVLKAFVEKQNNVLVNVDR